MGGKGGGRGEGWDMTQTMYTHVNKWIIKKNKVNGGNLKNNQYNMVCQSGSTGRASTRSWIQAQYCKNKCAIDINSHFSKEDKQSTSICKNIHNH
jgi:hypothetical protein